MEPAPIGVGRHADPSLERTAQRLGGAEAAVLGDQLELRCVRLQFRAGCLDAHPLDVTRWSFPDFCGEDAAEMPTAHRRPPGEQIESMIGGRVVVDVVLGGSHGRPGGPGYPDGCSELGLPARTMQEHHHPARHGLGDVAAVVGFDHRQGQIDPGGDSGRRPHVSVAAVDGVGIDRDPRVLVGQLPCAAQWVVTVRPSSRPASAAMNAPVHTVAILELRRAAPRIHSTNWRSNRAARAPSPPGISSVSILVRLTGNDLVTSCSPLSDVIGLPSCETRARSYPAALRFFEASTAVAPAKTSCGPMASRGCIPSNATMNTDRRVTRRSSLASRMASMTWFPRIRTRRTRVQGSISEVLSLRWS